MRILLEKLEEQKSLWDRFGGKDAGIDNFLTVMGFNPNRDYSPKKTLCPECGKAEVITVERHADTDMNCMVHICKACGHEEEI